MNKNRPLKVLFQSRLDLFDYKGGDTNQIMETKKALESLGVKVDIDLSLSPDLSNYDLVHIFNLDWVCEPYFQIKNAKKQNKPIVFSPIHHSLKEFENYEKNCRYGLARIGNFIIQNQALRDNFRNILKGLIYTKKLYPAIYQFFYGIRNAQRYCLRNSNYVLVQTDLEEKDLKKDFSVQDFKCTKVVNGVNLQEFTKISENLNLPKNIKDNLSNFIYSVGRIEPRKNQLNLIKAFLQLKKEDSSKYRNLSLFFSGAFNSHHPTYNSKFKKLLNENRDCIFHTGFISQQDLSYLFSKCKVYIVPSWFETTGLTFLEAAYCGAKSLVASGERTKEYLEDNALYCDPSKIQDIKVRLQEALNKNTVLNDLKKEVENKYTWEIAAKDTLKVYNLLK
ncbi:glycosyltransferase [Patescibacteria group bacterium]|nr:glycosyltransferase [Patescibacteria group bacterium]